MHDLARKLVRPIVVRQLHTDCLRLSLPEMLGSDSMRNGFVIWGELGLGFEVSGECFSKRFFRARFPACEIATAVKKAVDLNLDQARRPIFAD